MLASSKSRGIGVVSLERYEEIRGWTLIPARLDMDSDRWVAIAEHTDGRTLFCGVPATRGPQEAETGVRAMLPEG